MKIRIITLLILLFMIVCFVVPLFMKHDDNKQTEVVGQESTTEYYLHNELDLYAGVSKELYKHYIKNEVNSLEKTAQKEESKEEYFDIWTTTDVNIRSDRSINSEILGIADFNTHFTYSVIIDDWLQVEYNGQKGYIHRDFVSYEECQYVDYSVPENIGFKSFMAYKKITDKSSKQYLLQTEYAYTGNYGIRQVNGRFCVAIGTAFNTYIGDYIDLILENGTVIKCIVGDIKADIHTEANNIVTSDNGCLSEFIVDSKKLNNNIKQIGDISTCSNTWDSPVVSIRIYEKNVFD